VKDSVEGALKSHLPAVVSFLPVPVHNRVWSLRSGTNGKARENSITYINLYGRLGIGFQGSRSGGSPGEGLLIGFG
jgi:hypothetical protein